MTEHARRVSESVRNQTLGICSALRFMRCDATHFKPSCHPRKPGPPHANHTPSSLKAAVTATSLPLHERSRPLIWPPDFCILVPYKNSDWFVLFPGDDIVRVVCNASMAEVSITA